MRRAPEPTGTDIITAEVVAERHRLSGVHSAMMRLLRIKERERLREDMAHKYPDMSSVEGMTKREYAARSLLSEVRDQMLEDMRATPDDIKSSAMGWGP